MNIIAVLWMIAGVVFVLWLMFICLFGIVGAFAYLCRINRMRR